MFSYCLCVVYGRQQPPSFQSWRPKWWSMQSSILVRLVKGLRFFQVSSPSLMLSQDETMSSSDWYTPCGFYGLPKKIQYVMHSTSLLLHSAYQSFSMILGCAGDRQSGGNRMAQNGSTWYTPILFSSQFWRVSNISWFGETFKQSCSSDSYVG